MSSVSLEERKPKTRCFSAIVSFLFVPSSEMTRFVRTFAIRYSWNANDALRARGSPGAKASLPTLRSTDPFGEHALKTALSSFLPVSSSILWTLNILRISAALSLCINFVGNSPSFSTALPFTPLRLLVRNWTSPTCLFKMHSTISAEVGLPDKLVPSFSSAFLLSSSYCSEGATSTNSDSTFEYGFLHPLCRAICRNAIEISSFRISSS